jgi:hypothetical protein
MAARNHHDLTSLTGEAADPPDLDPETEPDLALLRAVADDVQRTLTLRRRLRVARLARQIRGTHHPRLP